MSNKYSVFESYEFFGEFSIDSTFEDTRTGRLTFDSEDGLRLQLFGSFWGDNETLNLSFEQPQIINGFLVGGKPISLYRNIVINKSGGFDPSDCVMTFSCQFAMFGAQFKIGVEPSFKAFEFSFTQIESWFLDQPFKGELPGSGEDTYTLKFKLPTDIKANIAFNNIEFKSNTRSSFKQGISPEDYGIDYARSIILRPQKEYSFDDFLNISGSLLNLFSILIGEQVYFTSIRALDYDDTNTSMEKTKLQGEVLFTPSISSKPKSKTFYELPTNFKRIENDLEGILNKWFFLNEKIPGAIHLFAKSFKRKNKFEELDLLIIIKAIEGYHRGIFENEFRIPPESHTILVSKVLDSLPELEDQNFLAMIKDKVTYSNDLSLRNRLRKLINTLPENLQTFLYKDKAKFIEKIINTRNYMTHYDETTKKEIFEGREALFVTNRLTCLLTILVYKELGFDELDSTKKLTQIGKFGYLLQKPILT